jgi:3-deoxy-D-manno-octulosonic acid (KDO) 8-phosphate synthase
LSSIVPGGIVFKASFDKANRSNLGAARGPGVHKGLESLRRVKDATGMKVITDVHLPEQCEGAAEIVDALQIPAFLCRQTDLLIAAGKTGKAVNVKKGQWLQPEGMRGAVAKVRGARSTDGEVAVTERGTFFGYGDLVVDMRSFMRMREATGVPVIFDATHSVQRPGLGEGGSSGGAREFIPVLAMAAIAAVQTDLHRDSPGSRQRTKRRPQHASAERARGTPASPCIAVGKRQPMKQAEIIERGRRVIRMERQALEESERRIDDNFARAVDLLSKSTGRAIVSGVGKSGHIGRKIAATLTSTGTPATFLHPAESLHGDLGIVGESDVAILISKSGESDELVALLDHLKRLGVCTYRDHRRHEVDAGKTHRCCARCVGERRGVRA